MTCFFVLWAYESSSLVPLSLRSDTPSVMSWISFVTVVKSLTQSGKIWQLLMNRSASSLSLGLFKIITPCWRVFVTDGAAAWHLTPSLSLADLGSELARKEENLWDGALCFRTGSSGHSFRMFFTSHLFQAVALIHFYSAFWRIRKEHYKEPYW